MPSKSFPILNKPPYSDIMIGNEAFVRGMIEAGIKVATTYPGSPQSGIGVKLAQIQDQSGIYFEFSTNEKVALEVAATASIGGLPAEMSMKSVGLNVAADSFVQLSKFTLPGGLVVIVADDPGPHSSQNEQDNRYYARLGKIPMIEPGTVQESKDFVVFASEYARKWQMPVVVRATTRTCHETGLVKFGEIKEPEIVRKFTRDLEGGYIPLPGTLKPLREKTLRKLDQWSELSNSGALMKETKFGDGEPQIAIVTAGHVYASVVNALRQLNISAVVLKLGIIFPLPLDKIVEFLTKYKKALVLEELDPFIEEQIHAELYHRKLADFEVKGKQYSPEKAELMQGEYHPSRVVDIICDYLGRESPVPYFKPELAIPKRSPQLCPGCGHRTALRAAQIVMEELNGHSMADIGCYTLGYLPPFYQGNVLYSMGSGAPSASGMSLALPDTPIMSFLGDSTFFHAAMPGIVNAIFNKHKQVLMIMDNGITAMTGHQPNPNTGEKSLGARLPPKYAETVTISMDDTLRAWGIQFVKRLPSYKMEGLVEGLKEAFEFAEKNHTIAVIIQEEPCALMRSTAERKAGTLADPYYIDQDVCRNIEKCIKDFSCPAIEKDGENTQINTDLCIGCGCCVQTCPMLKKPIKQTEDFKRI